MKLTLTKLNELKDCIKMSWLARASGWDRGSMYQYVDRECNMNATPKSIGRMRALVGAMKQVRRRLDRVIKYYEAKIPED